MAAPRLLIPFKLNAAELHASRIDAPVRRFAGATMGTGCSLSYAAPASISDAAIEAAISEACGEVIAQMSGWEHDSALSRFNRAPPGWREIPRYFAIVLKRALEIAELTDGAYDPALGHAVEALGFGPSGVAGATALKMPAGSDKGWRDIRLDLSNMRVYQPGGVALDLSSIAKGYAIDLCAERLKALGVPSFLVEIGGEFVGRGVKPDAQPWWVELELSDLAPVADEPDKTDVALVNLAVATSGDFVRRREGVSHLLDGRTRAPATSDLSGVAVIAESAMEADGWATALFALGPEQGMAMAEAQGLAALFSLRTREGARMFFSTAAQKMLG